MKLAIDMNQVSKRYGKKEVLKNIDLEVKIGEIYGLIGPSGSGKTTLVKLIMGMEPPTTGTIQVLAQNVPSFQVINQVGYMAQSDALYPELTGKENLIFFSSLFGLQGEEQKQRIEYVSNLVNLTEDLSMKVDAYSGGMKRRLSLAIALIHNPQILVLDEPTVGIDPQLRLSVWAELDRLRNQGKTILVTTHVMDEAEQCDQLAMVRDGKIIISGTPSQLKQTFKTKTLEEVFVKAGEQKS